MAIKTSTFGRVELSGNDAVRFVKHMDDDKPNPSVEVALTQGRAILKKMQARAALKRVAK